jgi:hypothetical protein
MCPIKVGKLNFFWQRQKNDNQQASIRNPQSAIRNPQSAIRNPQSAIRNPQSAIRNPQSDHDVFEIVALDDIANGDYLCFDYNLCAGYDLRKDEPMVRFLELCAK